MPPFSATQGQYLSFIYAYTEGFGEAPSEVEIAEAMKVKPSSVNSMLKTMVKHGLVSKQPGVARSIEVLVEPSKIPKWKKKLHCNLEVWVPKNTTPEQLDEIYESIIERRKAERRKKNNKIATRNSSAPDIIYRLKITLRDTNPPIWRRIETHDATIEQLHELIQVAMGWMNGHMHEFQLEGKHYTHPRLLDSPFDDFGAETYAQVQLTDWIAQHGNELKMKYIYDFGDNWEHDVVLEGVFRSEPDVEYPRCVTGKMNCPPEDVGGVWGFYDYVQAVSDPNHERHADLLDWGGPFDPNEFDPQQTTARMQQGLPQHP